MTAAVKDMVPTMRMTEMAVAIFAAVLSVLWNSQQQQCIFFVMHDFVIQCGCRVMDRLSPFLFVDSISHSVLNSLQQKIVTDIHLFPLRLLAVFLAWYVLASNLFCSSPSLHVYEHWIRWPKSQTVKSTLCKRSSLSEAKTLFSLCIRQSPEHQWRHSRLYVKQIWKCNQSSNQSSKQAWIFRDAWEQQCNI